MAVRKQKNRKHNAKGQALVEFIVMVPMVIAFLWYLMKVNMAINVSNVQQKHARSQLILKMLNHRDGPVTEEYEQSLAERSVFYLGISANVFNNSNRGTTPAPTVKLGVGFNPDDHPEADNENGEIDAGNLRQSIRIRSAYGICTSRKPGADGTLGAFCGQVPQ